MIGCMDKALMVIMLGWLGAMFGSFAGAQVWRLRAKQLVEDAAMGEKVNTREVTRLKRLLRPVMNDRSECLHCHHRLSWYDLLPIVSWLTLRGRCRYCRHRIGWMELFMEVGLAVAFIASYVAWPRPLSSVLDIIAFSVWLIALVLMMILMAYDAKWSLLPFTINIAFIVVALLFYIVYTASGGNEGVSVISTVGALLIVAGLYFIFALAGWSGLGDSILGVGLALIVARWEGAFLTVFLANLLGSLCLIPLAIRHRLHRKLHIPFGPFLIIGAFLAFLWGDKIIEFGITMSDLIMTKLML